MKKVELRRPDGSVKRGVYIETPWLRIEERAVLRYFPVEFYGRARILLMLATTIAGCTTSGCSTSS